jgi:hypothetical protein
MPLSPNKPKHTGPQSSHLSVIDLGLLRVLQVLGALHIARHVVRRSSLTLQGHGRERYRTSGRCSYVERQTETVTRCVTSCFQHGKRGTSSKCENTTRHCVHNYFRWCQWMLPELCFDQRL